jgi:hypothetical protein
MADYEHCTTNMCPTQTNHNEQRYSCRAELCKMQRRHAKLATVSAYGAFIFIFHVVANLNYQRTSSTSTYPSSASTAIMADSQSSLLVFLLSVWRFLPVGANWNDKKVWSSILIVVTGWAGVLPLRTSCYGVDTRNGMNRVYIILALRFGLAPSVPCNKIMTSRTVNKCHHFWERFKWPKQYCMLGGQGKEWFLLTNFL